jgi:demethylmenaquinone methyltransferase/2-methoxy-6-polyprenyl-1,4-benzoquinol methylase
LNKTVTPYNKPDSSKKEQVEEMFDSIAPRYDLLNHMLTMGIDIQWRKKAINKLKPYNPKVILDMATGTGDFAVAALKLNPERVIGMDISNEMLRVGREKMEKKGVADRIEMVQGDSEAIKLEDNSIDAITVGFGVRNYENLKLGLSEMHRVLRPGGAVAILEPSFPTRFPLKQLFQLYFRVFTPIIGKMISGNDAAYKYLPESVRAFPNGKAFTDICDEVGYKSATYYPLTFGSCSLYLLEK